jgi:hypothetical protein
MRFTNKIDEFTRQIEQLPFGSVPDVSLLFHCETQDGEAVSFSTSVETLIIGKGIQQGVDESMERMFRQGIIQNIRSILGGIDEGFGRFRDAPQQVPLRVKDVELKVA